MIDQPPASSPQTPAESTVTESGTGKPGHQREGSSIEDFLIAVSRLTSTISDSPIFSGHGIGPADWSLLKMLESGPLPISELVRRTNLSRQRVGVLVKELEAKQFLAVSQQSEGDRRTRMVRILPKASKTLAEISRRLETLNLTTSAARFSAAVKQTRLLLRLLLREKRIEAAARRGQKMDAVEMAPEES